MAARFRGPRALALVTGRRPTSGSRGRSWRNAQFGTRDRPRPGRPAWQSGEAILARCLVRATPTEMARPSSVRTRGGSLRRSRPAVPNDACSPSRRDAESRCSTSARSRRMAPPRRRARCLRCPSESDGHAARRAAGRDVMGTECARFVERRGLVAATASACAQAGSSQCSAVHRRASACRSVAWVARTHRSCCHGSAVADRCAVRAEFREAVDDAARRTARARAGAGAATARAGRGRGRAARQGRRQDGGGGHDAGVRVSGAGGAGRRHGAGSGGGLSGGAGGVRGGGRGARREAVGAGLGGGRRRS